MHSRINTRIAILSLIIMVAPVDADPTNGQEADNIGHTRHHHRHNPDHPTRHDPQRFLTSRSSPIKLPLPEEKDAFFFVVFGDRTGGPVEGVSVLADAVHDVNLLEPDLVMTVGDLIEGYNQQDKWMEQMREYKGIMDYLICPWFPVAGNHDIYWRGPLHQWPKGEHEADYEMHFGPLWYAFEHKNCWFITLYSDEGNPQTGEKNFSKPDCQKMSEEQFNWLSETLDRAKDADHVFLFLHHPRWLRGGYGDDWDRVHKRLVAAGNVSAVFAGHIHHARYDPADGIEYVALATVGGHQSAIVPNVGFLHHYDVVTVRKNQIAMASIPVGQAQDVREITGAMQDECIDLTRNAVSISGMIRMGPDGRATGEVESTIKNTSSKAIDVTVTPDSPDNRWTYLPDHNHHRIEAGKSHTFNFNVARPRNSLDGAFRPMMVNVDMEYLAPGCRYALPTREMLVPIKAELAAPPVPEKEMVLAFDGKDDFLSIPSSGIFMPEGPLTLECWMRANAFGSRVGLIAKTENSEYGFFVNNCKPSFSVFLGNAYVEIESDNALSTNKWYNVAGEYDGQMVRLYIDGALVGEKAGTGPRRMNDFPLMIGADVNREGKPMSYFNGDIDEVRLSKSARYGGKSFTPERRFEADANTTLLLHMDGLVGPWLYDHSPRGVLSQPAGGAQLVEAAAN